MIKDHEIMTQMTPIRTASIFLHFLILVLRFIFFGRI